MRGQGMAWIVFVLVGLGLVIGAGAVALSRRTFLQQALAAGGVVERLNAGGSHPEIGFTTASGVSVSYAQGGLIFGYQPGEKVRVLYLSDDPARTACLDVFGALWFVPLLLGALGLAGVAAGIRMLTGPA
jgi:hypothetical protein